MSIYSIETSDASTIKPMLSNVNILDKNLEYYTFVEDIIQNEQVLKMKDYIQHGTTSCYEHCLNVSYYSYVLAKRFGLDAKSCARAGMLHDLFLYDWHTNTEKTVFFEKHAFSHPKAALKNSLKYFKLNDVEKDAIEKHMWPVTMSLPKYKESFIIILIDKVSTVFEFFNKFFPVIPNK